MLDGRLLLLVTGASSCFVTLIVTPVVIRWAIARDLTDAPGGRKIHPRPVPRLGGVAVFAGTCIGLFPAARLLYSMEHAVPMPLLGILAGGVIVFAAGLADDFHGLTPRSKFAAQLAAGCVVYLAGVRVETLAVGEFESMSLGWLAFPVTIMWIVAVTNAVNLIDGIDGLASGIGLVALAATLISAIAFGRYETAFLAVALASALVGFLWYNFNPARVFLGDSGSLFLGYFLAVLSIDGAQGNTATVLVILPLSAVALPLFDTSLAIARRWLRGMAFSEADARHIHHRFLALGFTQRQTVIILCAVAALIAALGISTTLVPGFATQQILMPVVWIALPLLVIGSLHRLDYHEFAHALAVLIAGPRRLRGIIRERIMVSELAQGVRGARSSEELDAILTRCCDTLQVRSIEIGWSGDIQRTPVNETADLPLIRLEYPLMGPVSSETLVLRIWCDARPDGPLANAERIASVLAPAIEVWMDQNVAQTRKMVLAGPIMNSRFIHT